MMNKLCRAFAGAALGFAFAVPGAYAASVTLNETGSTLLYPLFQSWISGYESVAPEVAFAAAGTGSGAGIDSAIAGSVRIGASDAYLSDEVAAQHPEVLNIPLAISAVALNYNLPGLNNANLKIDGPTLAAIYSGTITEWDDARIKAMNPAAALPHQQIIPLRRADGSGDTFVFTQFLDFSADSWENNPGYGTNIRWPQVAAEKTARGNDGIVETLTATPYAIGYVGISYASEIAKAQLGTAMVENQAGRFLLATPRSIADAAAQLDPRTPPYERISLVFAPGDDSYPLVNYEYALVSKTQPNAATANALRSFLVWAISVTGGNGDKYLTPVGFIPLPDFIRGLSEAQIARVE
ncbi:MAG TPA: phosphate ABC transporter substrate-binding protein PstS [Steroidobacteraceae bacterium]|jgi:phosphate transport system substrate-binding protein|nr:phosphate ABC transporter substrate-binding protein PstS [Steroidobacteraceae bacterium]